MLRQAHPAAAGRGERALARAVWIPALARPPAHGGEAPQEGQPGRAEPLPAAPPRLLDVEAAARYLGVSPWTIRDLEAAGTLTRVRVPLSGRRELRKLLFDRADRDRLIDLWKE